MKKIALKEKVDFWWPVNLPDLKPFIWINVFSHLVSEYLKCMTTLKEVTQLQYSIVVYSTIASI